MLLQHGVPFPSLCQFKASLNYFKNGVLPEDGLQCETEYGAFENPDEVYAAMSSEDRELVDAGVEVINTLRSIRRGGS